MVLIHNVRLLPNMIISIQILSQKFTQRALARSLSWLEHHMVQQKVAGSIPYSGTYGRQQMDVSLSH